MTQESPWTADIEAALIALASELHSQSEAVATRPMDHWCAWLDAEGYDLTNLESFFLNPELLQHWQGEPTLEATFSTAISEGQLTEQFLNMLAEHQPSYLNNTITVVDELLANQQSLMMTAGGTQASRGLLGKTGMSTTSADAIRVGGALTALVILVFGGTKIHAAIRERYNTLADRSVRTKDEFKNAILIDAKRRDWGNNRIEKLAQLSSEDLHRLAKDKGYAKSVKQQFAELKGDPQNLELRQLEVLNDLRWDYIHPETRRLLSAEEKKLIEDTFFGGRKNNDKLPTRYNEDGILIKDARKIPADDEIAYSLIAELDRYNAQSILKRSDVRRYLDSKIRSEMLGDLIKKDHLAVDRDERKYYQFLMGEMEEDRRDLVRSSAEDLDNLAHNAIRDTMMTTESNLESMEEGILLE